MQTANAQYIVDVLGITSFIGERKAKSPEDVRFPVCVSRPLLDPEIAVLKKMLLAIQIEEFVVVEDLQFSGSVPFGLVCGSSAAAVGEHQNLDLGQMSEVNGRRWLVTYDLSQICDAHNPQEQMRVKKETWDHLRQMQREINSVKII